MQSGFPIDGAPERTGQSLMSHWLTHLQVSRQNDNKLNCLVYIEYVYLGQNLSVFKKLYQQQFNEGAVKCRHFVNKRRKNSEISKKTTDSVEEYNFGNDEEEDEGSINKEVYEESGNGGSEIENEKQISKGMERKTSPSPAASEC